MRAQAPAFTRQTCGLVFQYNGPAEGASGFASGAAYKQVCLKLRNQNACNLLYVIWRLDARQVMVQVKTNLSMVFSSQCGADGYRTLTPAFTAPTKALSLEWHEMIAQCDGDWLNVLTDNEVVWRGHLTSDVMSLTGGVGVRSDNISMRFRVFA